MFKLSIIVVILLPILQLLVHGTSAQDIGRSAELEPETTDEERPLPIAKKGLTFTKEAHVVEYGIDLVGCRNWSDPNGMDCNAYQGDTPCNESRPVLCAKIDNSPRPAYYIYGNGAAMPAYFYQGWNNGHITTSLPVQGSQFADKAAVDAFCAQSFGAGWCVATFHDGQYIPNMNGTTYAGNAWTQNAPKQQDGGWHFYSYGDVRNDLRYWVHIRDQPATCWAK